jgi:DNA-binding MarR family transcriptional regulator
MNREHDVSDEVDTILEQWRAARPDLDPSPMAVFGRIARVFTRQREAQARVFEAFGLTTAAFDLLANLRRSGPPHRKTATSLAESSMLTSGGVTLRMDTLEAAGLIRRVRDTRDRRLVYAELTQKGFDLIDRAIVDHLAMEHAVLAHLGRSERNALANLLAELEQALVHQLGDGCDT